MASGGFPIRVDEPLHRKPLDEMSAEEIADVRERLAILPVEAQCRLAKQFADIQTEKHSDTAEPRVVATFAEFSRGALNNQWSRLSEEARGRVAAAVAEEIAWRWPAEIQKAIVERLQKQPPS